MRKYRAWATLKVWAILNADLPYSLRLQDDDLVKLLDVDSMKPHLTCSTGHDGL